MNTFTVKTARENATTIKNRATEMNTILTSVKSNMNTLKNSWKSDAQDQYTRKFNELSKKFDSFYNSVKDFGDALNKVADIYENLEKSNKKAASNLSN